MDAGNQRFWPQLAAEAEATFAASSTAAEAYLQEISRRLQAEGVNTTYCALTGDVAQSLIDAAGQKEIDLLVISTHGRSGLNRWIYGSIANRVLRGVNCSLL